MNDELQNIIEFDEIDYKREMDWNIIKKDFIKTLKSDKFDLRTSTFDFILLPYYLFEMGYNIFSVSDMEQNFAFETSSRLILISSNKENILLYTEDMAKYVFKEDKTSLDDFNRLKPLSGSLLQKYVFDMTGFRFNKSVMAELCEFICVRLLSYMTTHRIKKILLYDRPIKDEPKLKTIFIRPTLSIK